MSSTFCIVKIGGNKAQYTCNVTRIIKIQTKKCIIFSYLVARDIHILRFMCLVYKISAIWNPSAEVFEQLAVTDSLARSPTITHDHPRPLRPVVQSVYNLPTIPTLLGRRLGRNMVVSPVWLGLYKCVRVFASFKTHCPCFANTNIYIKSRE